MATWSKPSIVHISVPPRCGSCEERTSEYCQHHIGTIDANGASPPAFRPRQISHHLSTNGKRMRANRCSDAVDLFSIAGKFWEQPREPFRPLSARAPERKPGGKTA